MNQSDIAGGGTQCTCIALAFLCLSTSPLKIGDLHQSHVIDRILQNGTDLYNLHFRGQSRYVLASELPSMEGFAYKCVQSDVFSGLINLEQ